MKQDYLSRRKIGSNVDLQDDLEGICSWRERVQFKKYFFEYFEELSSGQTGWGVSFNQWVSAVKGWKHLGGTEYEKIHGVRD
jgi:hypothetical protein